MDFWPCGCTVARVEFEMQDDVNSDATCQRKKMRADDGAILLSVELILGWMNLLRTADTKTRTYLLYNSFSDAAC